MQVVKGNLTKQQVTAIVNPTDERLTISAGVSKSIAKAAGPNFRRDCQDLLADLPDGQASVPEGSCIAMANNSSIPCQYIIQTAGPAYTGKLAPTPLVLFTLVSLHPQDLLVDLPDGQVLCP